MWDLGIREKPNYPNLFYNERVNFQDISHDSHDKMVSLARLFTGKKYLFMKNSSFFKDGS